MNILIGKKVMFNKDCATFIGTIVGQSWTSSTGELKSVNKNGKIKTYNAAGVGQSNQWTPRGNFIIFCPDIKGTVCRAFEDVKFVS